MTSRFFHDATHLMETRRSRRLRLSVAAGILAAVALTATGCSQNVAQTPSTTTPTESQSTAPSTTTQSVPSTPTETVTQLVIKDLVVGKGATAKAGDEITVDYTGWLLDGTKFDSSIDRHQPFVFTLGAGKVIEGWEKGFAGMKVGGTRQLIIPSAMGYGEQGAPPTIPPNATLKFEVKLLGVKAVGK